MAHEERVKQRVMKRKITRSRLTSLLQHAYHPYKTLRLLLYQQSDHRDALAFTTSLRVETEQGHHCLPPLDLLEAGASC